MSFTQTQKVDWDQPRDEEILELEVDVLSQTSIPIITGKYGDGRLPPGKHVVKVYKSDLHCVELKTEKFPDEVERAKAQDMAKRHDYIRNAVKDALPRDYPLPNCAADSWDGVPLPGIEGEVADAVRKAAWRYPLQWVRFYRESSATRNPDGTMRGPGTIRGFKVLRTLPPPRSQEAEMVAAISAQNAKQMVDAVREAVTAGQQRDRK